METFRVLGVDDCSDDLFLLRRALIKSTTLSLAATARDGLEAIAYLEGKEPFSDRQQFPLPDLIVLDLKMPGLDGFGFLEWIREHPERQCRLVVFTSSLSEEDRCRAMALGAKQVLIKPASPADYRTIAAQLEHWLASEPQVRTHGDL